jgi:hypothetical protein
LDPEPLGIGENGDIFRAVHRHNKFERAIKIMQKEKGWEEQNVHKLKKELQIL